MLYNVHMRTQIKSWTITYPLGGDVTRGRVSNGNISVVFNVQITTYGTGLRAAGQIFFPINASIPYYAMAEARSFVLSLSHELMNK